MIRGFAAVTCVAAMAMALRSHAIGRALWFDEAFSWRLSQLPWTDLVMHAARDIHSPVYFGLLKIWTAVVGASAPAMRGLSVLLGGATVVSVYLFCTEAWRHRSVLDRQLSGLLAALLVATDFIQIVWGGEIRMYALVTALAAASSAMMMRTLRPVEPSALFWTAYGVLALLLSLAHYYGIFTLAAQAAFIGGVLISRRRFDRNARLALVAATIVVAGWFAWLAFLAGQITSVARAWTSPSMTLGEALRIACGMLGLYPWWPGRSAGAAVWAVAVAVVLGAARLWRRGGPAERYVVLATLLPPAAGIALSVAGPAGIVMERYLMPAQVFYFVAVAALCTRVTGSTVRLALASLLAAGSIVAIALRLDQVRPRADPDLRACAEYIASAGAAEIAVVDLGVYLPMKFETTDTSEWLVYVEPDAPVWRGGAALTGEDVRVGPADLARLPVRRVLVVEIGRRRVPVPANWARLDTRVCRHVLPPGWNAWRPPSVLDVRVISYEVATPW